MQRINHSGLGTLGLTIAIGLSGCGSDATNNGAGTGGQAGADASSTGGSGAAGGGASTGGSGGGAAGAGGASSGGASGTGADAGLSAGGSGGGSAGAGGASSGGAAGAGGASSGGTSGTGADAGVSAGGSGGGSAGAGGASSGGTSGTGADAGVSAGGAGGGSGGAGGSTSGGGSGGASAEAGVDAGPDASSASRVVALNVDVSQNVRPISPLVYGVNAGAIACSNPSARFGLCRLGENPWSTYNWENNASNAGDGRCFENDDAIDASDVPGHAATSLITEAASNASLLTIPIIDYVAADKTGGSGPPLCIGDVRDSGSNYLDTRFKKNRSRKGAALSATPDTTDDFVNQDEFVSFVKGAAPGARVLFAMDNQPELWSQTHLEVHPAHATYAEVAARNAEYAGMVREVWPEAEITGGVGYGYEAFLDLQFAPDAAGKPDFISYYLAAMKSAGDTAGKRLVDYLDVHWYSEATGAGTRVLAPDATPPDPAVVAARVQAPRSLWDSTYEENSWISNDKIGGPIDLLHWLEQRIDTYYPGTKLAISAWSYGGDEHISGAIAAADALGIYGREGVGLAAVEPSSSDTSFLVGAFAAYRNYDGAGAAFGDRSVAATSSDVARVAVYASTDSAVPDRLVVIVINRSDAPADTSLTLQHAASYASADVYQITAQSALPQPVAGLVPTSSGGFAFQAPAYSISVIVPRT